MQEQIFRTAIEYFTKGKHYERAISLYEDLKQIYRDILFDYTSLASVLVCSFLHCTRYTP